MRKAIALAVLAAVSSRPASQSQNEAPSPPKPIRIATDLYDMTERWQTMFGLDGKLVISNARKDARAAPADGGIGLSFQATVKKRGWYSFTFIHVDDLDSVDKVNTVRVLVSDGINNPKPVVIGPEMRNPNQYVFAAPGEVLNVGWGYYPGGEGIAGGWRLMKTSYSDSRVRPSVPGYEAATGE